MTIPEIEAMPWKEPQLISTAGGAKRVKSSSPTQGFWNLWKAHKDQLKDAGFSIKKWQGEWIVSWWERKGEFLTPVLVDKPLPEGEEPEPEVVVPNRRPLKISSGLLPFQVPLTETIVAAMETFNTSLNGCGTGVGKTYITLAAVREKFKKLLVICPKPITLDWARAANYMNADLVGAFGWEWIKTGKTEFGHWSTRQVKKCVKGQWVLVNQRDKFIWTVPEGTEVAFDEIHRAAYPDTQNCHIVCQAIEQGLPIYGLSATIADDPTKMKAVGYMLGLHKNGKDYYDWMRRHGVVETRWGFKFEGTSRDLQAIHRKIFPHKGVRVKPEQIEGFPQSQIVAKAYQMDESKEISAAYREMMEKVDELECKEMDASARAMNILVVILRARQKVELLKVPLCVQLAEDALEEGMSVFVAVNFTDTLQELIKRLKVRSVICGGQKSLDRQAMIDAFQRNQNKIIVGNIKACREGLNLHDLHGGHPRLSLIMPTPSAFDLKQVLGRVWRAGGKTKSIQRILFAANTIEEDVCKSLATKLDRLDLVMDGDLQKGIFPSTYSGLRPLNETHEEENMLSLQAT